MYLSLKIDYVCHSCITRRPRISLYPSFSSSFLVSLLFISPFYSLFAAQAGASRVIAVEASEKMAAVATQVNFPLIYYEISLRLF